MKLIVGLGNYPEKYHQTRHNVGFMVVDALAQQYGFSPWKEEKKFGFFKRFQGLLSEGVINGQRVLLLKPQTYMNLSGHAVSGVTQFYKIPLEDVIVVGDDLDLDFGTVRYREQGSAGGHRGLLSIISHLGSDEFQRIKIGINNPSRAHIPTENFVLMVFDGSEQDQLPRVIDQAIQALLPHL